MKTRIEGMKRQKERKKREAYRRIYIKLIKVLKERKEELYRNRQKEKQIKRGRKKGNSKPLLIGDDYKQCRKNNKQLVLTIAYRLNAMS
jgi:hypothetical protein